jgi:hypothetical protein
MKSTPDPNTTPEQKMERLQSALGRVVKVPREDMQQALTEDEAIRRARNR